MSYCITFMAGDLKGKSFDLRNPTILIGRSHDCSIQVPKTARDVSRHHVCLKVSSGGVELANFDNENTMVEAQGGEKRRLSPRQSVLLQPGFVVRLAPSTAFILEQGDAKTSGSTMPDDVPTGGFDAQTGPTGVPTESTKYTSFSSKSTRMPTQSTNVYAAEANMQTDETVAGARPKMPPGVSVGAGRADAPSVPNRTDIIVTGVLTPEELQKLIDEDRKRHGRKIRKRIGLMVGAFLAVAGLYYYMQPRPEKYLSWPISNKGTYDVTNIVVNAPMGQGALTLCVPGGLDFQMSKQTNGDVRVLSRIGAFRDVPIWVNYHCERDVRFVHATCEALFEEKVRSLTAMGSWNFQTFKPISFVGKDNGLPYFEGQYLRSVGKEVDSEQRYGHLVFAVWGDYAITITKEIPAAEQWRGGGLVASNPMFNVDDKFLLKRWEGRPDARKEPIETMLAEAEGLLSNKNPMYWQDVEFLLQSVLIRSVSLGDVDKKNAALKKLAALREKEKAGFFRLKSAWKECKNKGDEAGCRNVLKEGEKIFASSYDQRNDFFRKGGWKK